MRWFKHFSDTDSDEKIAALIDAMGMEGYGLWWRTLEIIAKQMDETNKCEVTYSLPRWLLLLYSHHHRVGKFLVTLESIGLAEVSREGNKVTVKIPNLLKFRDNHTKNLQAKTKQVASKLPPADKQEVEVEVEVEVDKQVPPISPKGEGRSKRSEADTLFDEFWQSYPRKVAKATARKAWDKLKVDTLTSARMVQAIERQKQSEDWRKDDGRYIPHPATWLNGRRWEDEVNATITTGGDDRPWYCRG